MKDAQTVRPWAGKVGLAIVAGLLLATAWAFFYGGPAAAQADPYSSETPSVLPTRISDDKDPNIQPDVQGNLREDRDEVLPFTGGDVIMFLVIGAAALSIGFVLVRRSRTDN